ncbi:hypothetical protein D3C81_2153580 [compost metagenome]
MLDLGQPGLGQGTDLGVVAQNALHDAGLFAALLGQQLLLLRLEAQLLDQHGTGAFIAHHAFPVLVTRGFQHLGAGVFYRSVKIHQTMLHY